MIADKGDRKIHPQSFIFAQVRGSGEIFNPPLPNPESRATYLTPKRIAVKPGQ
jgi:hypothetical protein